MPATSLKEFLELVRQQPGKLNYASSGNGTVNHMLGEMFRKATGTDIVHVPYKGNAPALQDFFVGRVQVMFYPAAGPILNQIKEGKIRGYAVTTKFKVASLPELPTLDSTAIRGFEVSAWHAMWAPKGLPRDVSDKLVSALQIALKDPKVIERFASLGTEPVAPAMATPEVLKSHLAAEVPRWAAVIKAAGVKGN